MERNLNNVMEEMLRGLETERVNEINELKKELNQLVNILADLTENKMLGRIKKEHYIDIAKEIAQKIEMLKDKITIKELQEKVNKLEVENESLKGSLEFEKKLIDNYREYFKTSDTCPF